MVKFLTIASSAFMELVRQPVFLLVQTSSGIFCVFLSIVPYFGFGDDPKMVKDTVMATMLLAGLLCAVLSASASVAHEIRTGTALAVLAKPVGRAQFLLAKYFGLAMALTALAYFDLLAALLASRMAYDAYGSADMLAFYSYVGSIVIGYLVAAFANYFLHRPFVSDAVLALTVVVTLGFVAINFFDHEGAVQSFAKGVDWRLVPASVLVLFALWVLAGLALACSTRLEMIPTLSVCSAIFVLGLMSDYLFGERSEKGQWWATFCYTVIPNWQLFWMADALDVQRQIPWSYVGHAFGYMAGYLGAALAAALLLFEDRELS